jgi:hypothetical protein
MQTVRAKLDGVISFGKTQFDTEFVKPGEDPQVIYRRFNLTVSAESLPEEQQRQRKGEESLAIPSMLYFLPGHRRGQASELVLPPSLAAAAVQSGPRVLYDQLKALLPSTFESVSTATMGRFLSLTDSRPRHKVILVSSKAVPAPQARKLSLAFSHSADFGLVLSKQTAVLSLLEGVPSGQAGLYVSKVGSLPPPGMAESDVDPKRVRWAKYSGPSDYPSMHLWMAEQLQDTGPVAALMDQKSFERGCVDAGGICFVAVLPRPSSGTYKEHHETLRLVSARLFGEPDLSSFSSGNPRMQMAPIRFFEVDESAQTEWIEQFEASAPGMVALNARSGRFVTHHGSFTPSDLRGFVLDVLTGKATLGKIDRIAKLETVRQPAPKKKKSKKAKRDEL